MQRNLEESGWRTPDRKSTRMNSSLHSFPTRRSSDLVVTLITTLVFSPNSAGGATEMTSRDATESRGIWLENTRSEEHTYELQSTLVPYTTLFRSGRNVDHHARLFAKFSRGCARNDFQRCNGI